MNDNIKIDYELEEMKKRMQLDIETIDSSEQLFIFLNEVSCAMASVMICAKQINKKMFLEKMSNLIDYGIQEIRKLKH